MSSAMYLQSGQDRFEKNETRTEASDALLAGFLQLVRVAPVVHRLGHDGEWKTEEEGFEDSVEPLGSLLEDFVSGARRWPRSCECLEGIV